MSKRASIAIGVLVAVILAVAVWWLQVNTLPRGIAGAALSMPPAPSPNAFDGFRNAARALVDESSVQEYGYGLREAPPPTVARRLVADNSVALSKLSAALPDQCQDPIEIPPPVWLSIENLSHLLLLRGEARRDSRDYDGAMESCLDAIQMGEELSHGSINGEELGIICMDRLNRLAW